MMDFKQEARKKALEIAQSLNHGDVCDLLSDAEAITNFLLKFFCSTFA